VSKSLQGIIAVLNEQTSKEDYDKLDRFYVSVKQRASGIDNSEGRQKAIVDLYEKFFKTAFPKVTEKLGIVYTPIEIVDFIIHSVEAVLQKEFGRSMTDENVHILDPFTGTGTFITRLLQSGIIRSEDLERKYTREIHANEIILLAYYIASINIENVYHDIIGSREWGVGNREEEMGNRRNDNDLQRFEGLANGNGSGGDGLRNNKIISQGGIVQFDKSDKEGGGFSSGQHSGRQWQGNKKGLSAFSYDSQWVSKRVGNTSADSRKAEIYSINRIGKDTTEYEYSRAYDDGAAEVAERLVDYSASPPSTPHHPLPTPYSLPNTPYTSFPGICLTDTFQLGETKEGESLFSEIFPQNSERVEAQRKTPIRIIMGNPPYSIGQKSANDNAQNQSYPKLESRIEKTYVADSSAALNKSAYDSYIKAFRWASDRFGENGGIIGFITNSGWLESNGLDGFRKHLEKDFSKVYVFNLRGAIRGRSGESAKREGQNVFNIMTGVAITILVKGAAKQCLGEKK
jgi:predicted helicase